MTTFDPDAAAGAGSGLFGLPFTPEEARVVVVPVPFSATTSYGGGAFLGPAAVLAASRQVDLFDRETGRPYASGIAMLPESPDVVAWDTEARALARGVIDVGGDLAGDPALEAALGRVNALGARLNGYVHDTVATWLDRGKSVVTLGGDHAVPFGAMAAHAARHPGMGVLHVDAHADLREAYEGFTWSHASIMANVLDHIPGVEKLVQVGIRDLSTREHARIQQSAGRVVTFFDADRAARGFEGISWSQQVAEVVACLPRKVYVSFDIDGLDPALCPHTGTPVPGGLSFHEATYLLAAVVRSGRTIIGGDLTEVVPGPDGDEWDGNVGARVLYKLIGWMLRGQGVGGTSPTP